MRLITVFSRSIWFGSGQVPWWEVRCIIIISSYCISSNHKSESEQQLPDIDLLTELAPLLEIRLLLLEYMNIACPIPSSSPGIYVNPPLTLGSVNGTMAEICYWPEILDTPFAGSIKSWADIFTLKCLQQLRSALVNVILELIVQFNQLEAARR